MNRFARRSLCGTLARVPGPAPRAPIPKPDRFVWPPRPVPSNPAAPTPAEVVHADELARTWRDSLREALEETRRTWLDLTLPRLDQRLADAGFRPDPFDRFCPLCGLTADPPLRADRCEECANKRPPWQRVIRLGTYTPPLADVIRQIKFSRWRRLGFDLGVVLGRQLAAAVPAPRPPVVLVPVPISWRRRLARGLDHTLALCRGVRSVLGPSAQVCHLLKRAHGPSQVQVLASDRPRNVGNRIQPRRFGWRSVSGDCLFVVVDDVMTTGATMRASCRAVGEGLAGRGLAKRPVLALVAARTETPDGDRDDPAG